MAVTTGEDKRKHLEMLQGVINRMASNSFLFKGWSITLIAAISAFAAKGNNKALLAIPLVSTLLFWAIDAYYLMLERAFVRMYNTVAEAPASAVNYKMTPATEDKTFGTWLKTLKRPVLLMFYGVVLILLVILVLMLNNVVIEVKVRHGA